MIRRRINQGSVKGKRFQVSDVPDLSTSKGVAKENDEMRKLAMDLTSFSEEIQGKIDDVKALIPPPTTTVPTTTTGGGAPIKPPDSKFPVLEVWQDGTAIVIGTRVWDFHESSTVRFEVTDLGSQRARIRAHTKRSLNTMWGTFYGGYAIEVPATPGGQINHPAYIGKNSVSQPFTVQKDRSLIHWVGDTMSVEPAFEAALSPSATSGMGFNADRPKNELAAWTAYTQGITLSGSPYDVTTVKYRVTPNLQIFDPNELQKTTPHVTRIFLKNSPTIHPHVRVDDPVIVTTGNNSIVDPRTYTASMWFDLVAPGVNYSIENLGASGTNIGEVYSYQDVDTFYLRRLRASGTLSLQQDQNYITLIGSGYRYAAKQHSPGFPILMYDVPIGTNPETFWFRGIVPHGSIAMWISADNALNISGTNTEYSIQAEDGPEGAYLQLSGTNGVIDQVQFVGVSGTTVSWGDYDTIYISSEKNTTSSVDNCTSGVGSGEIYHESETLSGHTTYYLRKLLAGSGISITTQMHDVVVTSTVSGVSYDYLAVSSGTGVFLRLLDSLGVADDVQIVGSGGTTVSYIDDHTISISSEQQDSYTYGVLNCTSGTGEGYVFGTQTVSGTHTDFYLRTIKAGENVTVTTSGCDILIDASYEDTTNTYDILNCVSGTGEGLVYADQTVSGTHTAFALRTIKAGENVSITTSGCDITIDASYEDTNNTYNLVNCSSGTGSVDLIAGSVISGSNTTFILRKLQAASGITIDASDCDIVIGSTVSGVVNTYDMINCASGTGEGQVYAEQTTSGTNTTFVLRNIRAGENVTVQNDGCDIVIASTYVDTNNLYNVDNCASGTGLGLVYHDNTVDGDTTTFHFRHILAGSGIEVLTDNHDIRITSTVSGANYTLYAEPDGDDAHIRLHGSNGSDDDVKLVGSGSVDVEFVDDHTIRISAQDTNNTYEVENCVSGTGEGQVYAYTNTVDDHSQIFLRTIKAGDNVEVTMDGCDIVISASATGFNYYVDNCVSGTGTGLVYHDTETIGLDRTFHLRKIKAGAGITVETSGHDIVVASSGNLAVSGMNVDDCYSLTTDTSYGWYMGYDDTIEPNTRTLQFRTFGVQQDLYVTQCNNDYILTVSVSGIDNRNTLYPSIGVFQKNVQNSGAFTKELYFRGLRPGSGISLYLDESDNKSDIVISSLASPAKYYDIEPVCSGYTGQIAYLQSGTRGTGDTIDDPYTFLFRGIVAGSGISIDNTDPCKISIGTVTASGQPIPILDRIYRARNWDEPAASGTYCPQIKTYEIYGRTDSFSGTYSSNYGPTGTVSGLAYEVTDFKFRQLADFPNNNGVVLKMEKTSDALGNQVLEVATRNQNWQTSQDDCLIIDSTTGSIDRIHFNLPDSVWHPLFFEDINIVENYTTCLHPELRANNDVRVFRNTLPGSVPYWYFLPLDTNNLYGHGALTLADTYLIPGVPTKDTTLWQVTVRLGLITGSPTNDAGIGGVAFPQIALFRNETYWRNLDVDVRISDYAQLRAALVNALILDSQAASPRKVWLHGTALIQLQDGQSLTARYRHMTGSTRYHEVVEGSIDIIKVGMQNTNVYNTYTLSGTQNRVVIQGYSF